MAPLTIPIAGSSPRILPSRSSFLPIETLNNAIILLEQYHLRPSLLKSHYIIISSSTTYCSPIKICGFLHIHVVMQGCDASIGHVTF